MTKTKSRPMVRIHDLSTDEIIDREMNDAEFENYKIQQAAQIEADAIIQKAQSDKAAILERLGLTEDELKTIIG